MKKILIVLFAMFSLNAFARNEEAASKMLICMEAGRAAGYAFDIKESKQRLVYPKIDDVVLAALYKRAMDIGYKAPDYQKAVQNGHDSCVKSKLWNENSL